MNKRFGLFAFIWIAISYVALMAQVTTNVRYIYDEEGQLIGAIDENNNATTYRYDAVGNLSAIERLTARGPVDIFFVEPNRGRAAVGSQPGTPVTIHGIGFSAVPSENQVTFNGMTAVVNASTTTMIKTSVPAGATTGPVRVTSPSGMATSRSDFILLGINVTVSPARVDLRPGQRQQFTATLTEGGAIIGGEVVWSLNPRVGTIDRSGLYTAGSALVRTVTVIATSVEEMAARGTATVNMGIVGPIYTPGASYRITSPALTQMALAPIFNPGASYANITITALSPNRAARGTTGLSLTVTGTNFNGATGLDFLLPGGIRDTNITTTNVTVNPGGTQLTATVSIAGAAPLGARTVVVRTPAGPTATAATASNQFVIE